MKIPRWLLLTLLALVIVGAFTGVRADEDDDEIPAPEQKGAGAAAASNDDEESATDVTEDSGEEDGESPSGEEEAKDPDAVTGLFARTVFPGYGSLKIPAGEKIPALIAINNAATNPNYNVIFVSAHLSPAGDTSRFIQNFSGNPYQRNLNPGETSTIKYSFTPDSLVDPNDYSLVIRVFFNTSEDKTFLLSAFNETITITEPLGTDFKSIFTAITFVAAIGYAGYWFFFIKKKKTSRPSRVAASSPSAGPKEVDVSYIPADHQKYLQDLEAKKRNRSSSK